MSKGKIFFYLCLFFILGTAIASYSEIEFPIFYIYAAVTGCLTALALGWQKPKIRFLALGGVFLLAGIFRFQISLPAVDENKIQFYNGEKVTFQGVVSQEPDERLDHTKLKVKSQKLKVSENWEIIQGNVLVKAGLYPEYQYGDELRITCKLRQPEPFHGFDYDKYLARWDIYSLCFYPEITLLSKNQGNPALAQLFKIKHRFQKTINQIIVEPQASLLNGVLLGLKRGITQELHEDFRKTGTAHIIVVSGMHIAIIAQLLTIFFSGLSLGRRRSFWLSIFIILTFVMVIGFPASAFRGAILGILLLTAQYLGRLRKIANALAFTAFLMLLINPKLLRFDLSFQLSFLATLGIVYLKPLLDNFILAGLRFFYNSPLPPLTLRGGVKDIFTTTLSAIILTAPLILYNFGQISLIAPLANILILLVIPFLISLGFFTGIVGMVWLTLGKVMGWGIWLILSYVTFIIKTLANFKFATLTISQIHWTTLLLIYLIIGVWWWSGPGSEDYSTL